MHAYKIQIEGMSCSMCAAHVAQRLREAFQAQKVQVSAASGDAYFQTVEPISEVELKAQIESLGYQVQQFTETEAKKGFWQTLFGRR